MKTGKTLQAKVCLFELDEETHWYCRTDCPPGFNKVPSKLKLEETARPDIIHASLVIHGRQKNGKYLFFTGLLPTPYSNLYYGDYYESQKGQKVNSFCLFFLSEGNRRLSVHFFNAVKIYPNKRDFFIADYWRGRK